jgi:hypothetical protein
MVCMGVLVYSCFGKNPSIRSWLTTHLSGWWCYKLLGYIITERNIEANPDKILSIAEMGQVRNVKDVQQLMGCLTALSRFMSWLGERGLRLCKLLKKADSFRWTEEAHKALDELRTHITKSPVLASPKPGETLLLYVAGTTQVISMALVVEREEPRHIYKPQRPVYYISKVLSNYETHYNQVQKQLYAILITKRKLLHYFESHPAYVVASHGLGEIVRNRLTTGRIAKWALELMGLDIIYVSQMAIKSQALAEFVVEWTETQHPPASVTREHWSMYFDDSSTLNEDGGGIVLISPKGDRLLYVIRLHFCVTNNTTECEALVNGLHITAELRV